MRNVIGSIEGEYRRYKVLAEGALRQVTAAQLAERRGGDNSMATIAWHVAGNLRSRFTDFLSSDGEKPWRDRESEFLAREVTLDDLLAYWEEGWTALFTALSGLTDDDLGRTVTIREQPLSVIEALHRSLAHAASHVGQIVFLGKHLRGGEWRFLSIPPGQSAAYNRDPRHEKPPAARG